MSAQTIARQDSIHLALEECYLCQNCHRVGNSAIRCPACASETSLMSLASALARPDDSERLAGIARAVDALKLCGDDQLLDSAVPHQAAQRVRQDDAAVRGCVVCR